MPEFIIKDYPFREVEINKIESDKEQDWPVVYHIRKNNNVYIGETVNFKNRMLQHLKSNKKEKLDDGVVNIILDEEFNKSAALDLESFLIQNFSAEDKFNLLNGNDGLSDHSYYNRSYYTEKFVRIWQELYNNGITSKTLDEVKNDALYKYSPYKALNIQQEHVVYEVLCNIEEAIAENKKSISVITGDAGTGKTIVIMYLAKLIADLQVFDNTNDEIDENSNFKLFFEDDTFNKRFKNKKIALIIPQESLRGRIQKILKSLAGGGANVQIFSPITFGKCEDDFDIALIDEGHLLKVGFTGQTGQDVQYINEKLFGNNDVHTEFDWIAKKAKNIVIVYSEDQRIRPTNIEPSDIYKYNVPGMNFRDNYKLEKQMRSLGDMEYIKYVNDIFSNGEKPERQIFDGFEMKMYTNLPDMFDKIRQRNDEIGLARVVAGFSWDWKTNSKKTNADYDMEIDGMKLRWNSTRNNWIGRKESIDEVGSIYTVQGEDLNYIGVIIGEDLIYRDGKLQFNKNKYADSGALKRSQRQTAEKVELDDNYFLEQVLRVYRVLMNRAIKGVYVYACDKGMREYLAKYF
ncbi:DUF2075 domain-containing protein [Candidatus Saccharibacteria bacterium]|nr:DUF2075 domain-containing protein [Candidatus Saccharibacteria bacterium]MBR3122348.1 DUF2075 domain-containing protein [Candidatus Saccharibacteria bacterium]